MWSLKKKPKKLKMEFPSGTKTITVISITQSSLTCVIESCEGIDKNGFLSFKEPDGTESHVSRSLILGWTVKDW